MKYLVGTIVAPFFLLPAVASDPGLLLEHVAEVSDPLGVDLEGEGGDLAFPSTCTLGDTTVSVELVGGPHLTSDAKVAVTRDGTTQTIKIENASGRRFRTLVCDAEQGRFYFGHPLSGRVLVYGVKEVLGGSKEPLQVHAVEPFNRENNGEDLLNMSLLTAASLRDGLVLIEWFNRTNAQTRYCHRVLTREGTVIGEIHDTDLLLTNKPGPGWQLFQGGGSDRRQYLPRHIYRLTVGDPTGTARPAVEAVRNFAASGSTVRTGPVAKLAAGRIQQHIISFLTPTRVQRDTHVSFCPVVPSEAARYWLGNQYESVFADNARAALLAFASEREAAGNTLDAWFQSEVATREPMKSVLARFDATSDAWVAEYQQALLSLAGPKLDELVRTYGNVEVIGPDSSPGPAAPPAAAGDGVTSQP